MAVALPRLGTAFVLSALTHRAAVNGTAGPAVRGVAAGFTNWDASYYLAIAEHGYAVIAYAPFFPLQALLIRAGASFLGFPNAAIVVTWLAFGVAVWGIAAVAARLTTSLEGRCSVPSCSPGARCRCFSSRPTASRSSSR